MFGWTLYLFLAAYVLTVLYVVEPRRSVFVTLCAVVAVIIAVVGTAVYRVVSTMAG